MVEIGLIGSPNAGKSTLFKALTLKDVKIAPYPFTTLDPNEGLGYVTTQCPCQGKCKNCIKGTRFVPVKILDVAGLVPEAHLGKGRGNAFLSDAMRSDAIIMVLDVSGRTDSSGNDAEDFYPSETVGMLEDEIDYWISDLLQKDLAAINRGEDFVKIAAKRLAGLGITEEKIKSVYKDDAKTWNEDDFFDFARYVRKISKPMIIAANKFDMPKSPEKLERLRKKYPDYHIIPISAEIELALKEAAKENFIEYMPGSSEFNIISTDITEKQRKGLEFINSYLQKNTTVGVQLLLNTIVYEILQMITVYPVENETKMADKKGNVLPDAFLMRKGSTALDLAYKVHEDIGKKFIAAYNVKERKPIGADYVLKHSDIISIKSGR